MKERLKRQSKATDEAKKKLGVFNKEQSEIKEEITGIEVQRDKILDHRHQIYVDCHVNVIKLPLINGELSWIVDNGMDSSAMDTSQIGMGAFFSLSLVCEI